MKICRYCNCENSNKISICSYCGANEFSYKCENCENVFDEGLFCPRCGVKAGQKPKVCPNCEKKYYSNVCPDCGYGKSSIRTTTMVYNTVSQVSAKKRKTWLWVIC